MYQWRLMTPEEREATLKERQMSRLPWHSPPHWDSGEGYYHITAACYEHQPILGFSKSRLTECEKQLINLVVEQGGSVVAWCILPNHYHLLAETEAISTLIKKLGLFHGRSSFLWNGEEQMRGRKVWSSCAERVLRSMNHFWATMNYIHHNPVHHHLVSNWLEWPFSSASQYLDEVGKNEAARIWREYPILDYGKGWDDP